MVENFPIGFCSRSNFELIRKRTVISQENLSRLSVSIKNRKTTVISQENLSKQSVSIKTVISQRRLSGGNDRGFDITYVNNLVKAYRQTFLSTAHKLSHNFSVSTTISIRGFPYSSSLGGTSRGSAFGGSTALIGNVLVQSVCLDVY